MTTPDERPAGRTAAARELLGLTLLVLGAIGFLAVVASFSPIAALGVGCLITAGVGVVLTVARTEE